jgi:hypothetical protein
MIPKGPLYDVPRADIAALVKAGESDHMIAQRYGVNDGMIQTYRRKHNIGARLVPTGGNAGSILAAEMASNIAEMRALCTDRGREADLFAGLSFQDSPRASAPEARFTRLPEPPMSLTGCAAAMTAAR